jgi:hypothetical protein
VDLPEYQLKTNTLQRRLGECLLAEGILQPEQLDEAIEYQCIYGARLGTSLIELGFVTEEHLAQVLSQQLKLHYIKPELLMNVPAPILNLVPKKLAHKYRIVPYHKEGRRLFLAMNDASNLADIDEISFQLDHIIIPLAIPEIRLLLALKKHYGLELSPRFESLSASLKRRAQATTKVKTTVTKSTEPQEEEAWPLLGAEDYAGEEATDDAYFNVETPPLELSHTSLCQQLASAADRNDIARALINYLGQEFSASALLMARPTCVSGWLANAGGSEPNNFDQLSISLQEHSVFSLVVNNKNHYLGPVAVTPQNMELLSFFESTPPQNALVLPLLVRDRLVCILYIQDQIEVLQERVSELQNLTRKAEMAFTLLILKNKILTT